MLFKIIKTYLYLRLAFLLSGIIALALASTALYKGNTKDGLLTLTFDISNTSQAITLPRAPVPFSPTPLASVLSEAQAGASSAVGHASTAAPALGSTLASDAQAAASSAVSQAQAAANAVASEIPRNLTLGTKYYCVGFSNHTDCHNLPFKLSDILPQSIINDLATSQPFHWVLGVISSGVVHVLSLLGLSLISVVIIICAFGFCFAGRLLVKLMKMVILGLSLICFLVLLFPMVLFYILRLKAKFLPSVGAETGLAGQAFLGAVVSVVVMSILASFMFIFL